MKLASRIIISILSAVIAYFFTYFPLMFFFRSLEKTERQITALVLAISIGGFLWLISRGLPKDFIASVLKTALLIGAIGLTIGYVGPLISKPQANQGPLLGIFISGPLSFLVGLIGGAVYWKIKLHKK